MYRDIAQHIRSCQNCAMNKCSRRKRNGYLNSVDPPEGVWKNLAMDFVGPITPPSSGNKYILVITDLLSKFVVAKPTRDNSAISAAKVLVEEVILKYGSPNQLLTDKGTHFSAELFNSITSLYGICHVFTTPYNPRSNGVCERFNSYMCDTLQSMSNNQKTDWDQQLSKLVFAYNTSRHVSTRLTPYEMMFGRLCKLPFDLPKQTTTTTEPHQYVKQVHQYLVLAKEMAHTKILQDQTKSKQRYNTNRTNENYSIGDFVYVKRLGLYHKLTTKFYGPYEIIQKLNESIYRIQNPNDLNEIINVHLNRLRRWHSPTRTN